LAAQRDYYAILQLNQNASEQAIAASYKRLSRIYDPQTSKKARASQRKRELDEAYAVLSDARRRAEYDRLRARGLRPNEMAAAGPKSRLRQTLDDWLYNPYIFAGLAATGVIVIVIALVLISVFGGGGSTTVLQPSGSPAGLAPATPPAVAGQPVTTASGLQYIDITPGTGDSPAAGQQVTVNYTGWLQSDNTKFDSSLDRNEPFSFILGGNVIKGWDEGVATMKVGGKRRLIVPPDLAYGGQAQGPIPANSTLIFDIDLLNISQPSASAPATAQASPTP